MLGLKNIKPIPEVVPGDRRTLVKGDKTVVFEPRTCVQLLCAALSGRFADNAIAESNPIGSLTRKTLQTHPLE
ncbi:hypothetical protein KKF81_02245 [Candidatus Micrarchaeota archaeon]|nr:hypothetical protein [Candidatus Micrarchaeota archaeon]MBU1165740.1 hypothetical protein [Candidatus Micrarchaeota archaeon]MBU1887493.1 hypothetical protein [Candidatus Micrarchaeota archaeon]